MSEEIFGAVQKLPVNGTKKQVVLQCAPLLTGIKLSNLLNVRADQKEEVFKLFEGSKICCRVLYEFRGRLSILLYRPGMLAAYLEREDVQKLMTSFGYGDLELEEILDSDSFVRISNSEIVNVKKIIRLDTSITGTIRMYMKGDTQTFVSRRYVSRIKKTLKL